jgi:hypothetical protein
MMNDVVAHAPSAWFLLRPTNRLPTAGPVAPSHHSTDCSSVLIAGISSTSATTAHTRSGGASIQVSASAVGLSAYRAPVHSISCALLL